MDLLQDGLPPDRSNWYSAEEYQHVLEANAPSEAQKRMLIAHASAPNLTLTVQELAKAAGYAVPNIVYSQYGKLGHSIADALGHEEHEHVWTRIIGDDRRTETGEVAWRLEPAIARAILRLGWIRSPHRIQSAIGPLATTSETVAPSMARIDPSSIFPDEVDPAGKYAEGATRAVMINAIERNTAARRACLKLFGYRCSVCDIDFGKIYGTIGKSFIHVHHVKRIATRGEQYFVDPQRDLVPVCPNCHAMLHTSDPPLSIVALKEIITQAFAAFTKPTT